MSWVLVYLALNSPVSTVTGFVDKEACEHFRSQLRRGMTIKESACIEFTSKGGGDGH